LEIKIIEFSTGDSHVIEFSDPCYTAYIVVNMEFSTTKLRYGYTSLTKPSSVYEYDMKTRSTMLLKRQEVLGDFTPDDYTSERLWATARDGKEVAISLVYRNSTPKSSETPLLLYGYGSYGHTVDASFPACVFRFWTGDLFLPSPMCAGASTWEGTLTKRESC